MSQTYTKSAVLPVGPDEAFALITEPERLRRWQTVSAAVDLRAGGGYRWTVTPGHIAAGTFREVEPGRRVVFGWGWEGSTELPPDASTVTVTVEPVDGGTRVTLEHADLTDQQAASHAEGWNHYLGRLETLAGSGDAGVDEWSTAPEHLDQLVAAEAALAVLQPVLRGLTDEDRTKPTPCSEFDCHGVAEHLFGSLVGLGSMAGVEVRNPETGSLENRVSVMADQAITGWRARGLDGSVPGPGGHEMPAGFAASILSIELLLHGWDFAQASGQKIEASEELVGYVRGLAEQIIPGSRSRGAFGDEVEPWSGASSLDSLAAYSGRTPVSVG
ncbi:TIGR03086 family metal-binding protein [Nocardioides donggukensis]|uniref:TIGR03086 family protein n=1 Tax=Nocardioides donggukensis TaxID=2774019 RepID=A0A927KAI8_9ACTN|nr:TIGR03086 family metal-binding protein [Nocardioides donggukensis]MBD8870761.1 TIGR03086 family protein [Nocardioides donggukensis]